MGPSATPEEIRAVCKRLVEEFAAELEAVRADLDYLEGDVRDLQDRVAAVEDRAGRPRVFGFVDYRIGHAGEKVGSGREFDNLTAKFGVEGKVTGGLAARVALKVRDSPDPGREWFDEAASIATDSAVFYSGPAVDGYGRDGEQVWLDEAYLVFPTRRVLRGDWTWGRQYVSHGLGLLVNNERRSQQGLRARFSDMWNTRLDLDVFAGGSEHDWTSGPTTPADGTDGYLAMSLGYCRPAWKLAGQYLARGYGGEEGWAADFWGKFWGREVYVEYAQLITSRAGVNASDLPRGTPTATMAMLDVWRGRSWALRGYWSSADADYDVWYSTLNPYYEQYGGTDARAVPWERWLRNPPAMTNVRVVGGRFDCNVSDMPVELAYYDLRAKSDEWAKSAFPGLAGTGDELAYDRLWSARFSREVADGVRVGVTWARQQSNNSFSGSAADERLLMAEVSAGF